MKKTLILSLILCLTSIGFAGAGVLEEYERLEYEQQQIIKSLSKGQDAITLPTKELPNLPFPLVDTYEMHKLTNDGIVDLTWDGQYLWGIDGDVLDDVHYVVKISPVDFQILEHSVAPDEGDPFDGSTGIAFGDGYLWVTNTFDKKIYAVDPGTKAVDPERTIDVSSIGGIIDGGHVVGNYLWIIRWDPLRLYRANIMTKEVAEQFILSEYETGYDLTYLNGSLWIMARSSALGGLVLKVNPTTGAVQGEYDRMPTTSGIAFTGDYLITANSIWEEYYKYEVESTPPPTFDGTGIQITGTSSNITMNVVAGDTVEFTVHTVVMGGAAVEYRFFTRAGYGEPDWGGNKWTIVQPYSPNNTVMHTFDTPGIYFLAGHVEYPGETWEFGDPQTGIVVEVWPAQ